MAVVGILGSFELSKILVVITCWELQTLTSLGLGAWVVIWTSVNVGNLDQFLYAEHGIEQCQQLNRLRR